MKCSLCEARKARRYCPGVQSDICSQCCGTEREVTIACPLGCEYLHEAHTHEKRPELDVESLPNRDIRVSDEFLARNESLLVFLSIELLESAVASAGAIDFDVREALETLIRTYRTLESGLYYETRPVNPIAGNIHTRVQEAVQRLRDELKQRSAPGVRDADVLGALIFLQRLEHAYNNGRKRGRAFLDHLYTNFPKDATEPPPPASLIQV